MSTGKPAKTLRCAVYTRKSTEHGLELEFNSLQAQREACEAYVKSQASEGWQLLARHYDDPAYSGGNLDRPGVQALLKDIEAGLIDVVVVYKIDRLTRSLADFAKLVEVFDAQAVSFVAVTQQFNTTTSMGRLTLNVLLSFAQFERELASERVRDKVAASRKKGKWMGGSVPLGYDSRDKRLVVNPAEATIVRTIFTRYLELGSFQKLINELDEAGIVTKRRQIGGRITGGIPFTYGPLAYLLKNRTYLGEAGHGGRWYPGEHEPIVDRATFEKVQNLLQTNSAGRTGRRERTGALLTGLIYDDRGNRMSPSYSVKNGVRYPFYVSSPVLRGRKTEAGSLSRLPAREVEAEVLLALRQHVPSDEQHSALSPRQFIEQSAEQIVVRRDRLEVTLTEPNGATTSTLQIPWSPEQRRGLTEVNEGSDAPTPPPDIALVQSIVRAHQWLKLLTDGAYDSIEALSAEIGMHPKVIRSRIKLAFLAPELTKTLLSYSAATPPQLTQLCNPLNWAHQCHQLRISSHSIRHRPAPKAAKLSL